MEGLVFVVEEVAHSLVLVEYPSLANPFGLTCVEEGVGIQMGMRNFHIEG